MPKRAFWKTLNPLFEFENSPLVQINQIDTTRKTNGGYSVCEDIKRHVDSDLLPPVFEPPYFSKKKLAWKPFDVL